MSLYFVEFHDSPSLFVLQYYRDFSPFTALLSLTIAHLLETQLTLTLLRSLFNKGAAIKDVPRVSTESAQFEVIGALFPQDFDLFNDKFPNLHL